MAVSYEKCLEILRKMLHNDLYCVAFKERFRMKDRDFTRHRKLDFSDLSLLILEGRGTGITRNVMTYLRKRKAPSIPIVLPPFARPARKSSGKPLRSCFMIAELFCIYPMTIRN